MRVPKGAIRKTMILLEEILRTPEYLKWCQHHNAYVEYVPFEELEERLREMHKEAYNHGFIIQNYREIVETALTGVQQVWQGDAETISQLNEETTLACIALIFRTDRFCEGALMSSITHGLLLKYYRHLMEIATAELAQTVSEDCRCPHCHSVHTAPILWGMPAFDQELARQEINEEIYIGGCCISDDSATHHCFECRNDFTPEKKCEKTVQDAKNAQLTKEQILKAHQIFCFDSGKKNLYIEMNEGDDFIHCCGESGSDWWTREAESFWWSWEMDPMLYAPMTGEEASSLIAQWEERQVKPFVDREKLNKAIAFAVERHSGQVRKGTNTPYITHPMEVMSILSSMQADTELLIAGLLHDTIEDTDTTRDEIAQTFGEDVAELVSAHSEDKSKTWDERKTAAIEELKEAPVRLKMLIMADKVSNLRCLSRDYQAIGERLWERFNAPVEKQAWYYGGIQDALDDMQEVPEAAPLYWEMVGLYKDLFVTYYTSSGKLYQVCRSGESYRLKQGNPAWEPFEGNVPKKAQLISRYKAEALEDIWNEPFYEVIKTDLKNGSYQVFHSATRTLTIDVKNGSMTLHGEDYDSGCEVVNGKDDCEFFYSLRAEDTERLLNYLRRKHGMKLKLATVLKKEFGTDNGSALFRDCCRELGISWGFFAS